MEKKTVMVTSNHNLVVEQLPQQFPTAVETVYGKDKKTIRFYRGQLLGNIAYGAPTKEKGNRFKKTVAERVQLSAEKQKIKSARQESKFKVLAKASV